VGFIRSFKGFLYRVVECHAIATKALCMRCKFNRGKTDRFKTNTAQLNCASFDCRYAFQLVSDSQQVKPQRFYQNIQNRNTQPITKHYKFSNMARFSEHPLFEPRQVKVLFIFSDVWNSPSLLDNAVISMGLRRPSREANLSPQSDAKVNEWSYTSTDYKCRSSELPIFRSELPPPSSGNFRLKHCYSPTTLHDS